MRWIRNVVACVSAAFAVVMAAGSAHGQGIYLPTMGSVNGSMGGASTAAPMDALGALYWNPATISGLKESEVVIGSGFAFPNISTSSTLLGAGGTTVSDSGIAPLSGTALVYRFAEMPKLTIGQFAALVGGGAVNFPGDPTNPIFQPKFPRAPLPGGFVLGPSFSSMAIYQSLFAASYQVTERLSIGGGPVIDIMTASFDPAFFAPADDANGDGIKTFPSATHARPFWGLGFKAGLYYHITPNFDTGFGYCSPQWMERFYFNSRDELGNPRTLTLKLNLPAFYSWGFAYKGIEKLTLAADFRMFDNSNALLFGTAPAAGGLGWQDVFAAAFGAQYQFSEKLATRIGYEYNTQTIASPTTLFNVQGPAVGQNMISVGATVRLAENFFSSVSYAYSFKNSVSGSAFQIPGSGTTLTASANSFFIDMTVRFGTPSRHGGPSASPSDVGSFTSSSSTTASLNGTSRPTTALSDGVALPPGQAQVNSTNSVPAN
jgi:long-chain fatty acid transport protein